ncbi:arsenate reductase family protein [Rubritalea tangerina]|uniref:Arsenate reductase family protein n=1 Tax=Rubritalea tangerina TaxID=430798 RepID=A0ABW4ZCE3_9BACT
MAVRYYSYKNCGTCRKAKKWLVERGVAFEEVAIRDTPPSIEEFQKALAAGYSLKALFNSSGGDYRELGMKDKLPNLSEAEALELLAGRGNLVKRPFVILDTGALVGFKEADWQKALG